MKQLHVEFWLCSQPEYELRIEIDGLQRWQGHTRPVPQSFVMEYDPDQQVTHKFQIEIAGKQQAIANTAWPDPVINSLIHVHKFRFNQVDILPMLDHLATYTHNFNGQQAWVTEPFGRCLGCDGHIAFDFVTPISSWLITHYPF